MDASGLMKGQEEKNQTETLVELRNVSEVESVNLMLIGFEMPGGGSKKLQSLVAE